MTKRYLIIFGLLIGLLIGGCKKNDVAKSTLNSTNGSGTGGKSNPTIPSSSPQLLNFKINGVTCAYDSLSLSYYYPVTVGASLSGFTVSYDTTATKTIYMDNVRVNNGSTSSSTLTTNETVAIKAVNALNVTTTYSLVITGLPIVMLQAGANIGDDDINAKFDLVDPNYGTRGGKPEVTSNITISIRGGTSRYYPKSSYSVHTVDDAAIKKDVSLLGLRSDNSWILDAMYIDQARMRNRLCTDIWNSFNNVPYISSEPTALNGTRGYMAEVFLNGKYHGIYCLTEKLDRKQLQIEKQYGDMYKADFWTNESDFTNISPYDNTSATWGGWELEYPAIGDTPAPDWGYLYNEVNFIASSSDADFSSQIKNKVDINNIVDYFIFINIMATPDNENKNTFFSFYDYRNAPAFFYSVWDLDGSMGRNAGGNILSNQVIGTNNNNLFQRLMKLNPENFKGLLKTRWNALKNSQLSKATVGGRVEAYRQQLVNTNAITRERLIWTNITQDLNTEATYMTGWYGSQWDLVDNYINGL